jgi:hypothetical protein
MSKFCLREWVSWTLYATGNRLSIQHRTRRRTCVWPLYSQSNRGLRSSGRLLIIFAGWPVIRIRQDSPRRPIFVERPPEPKPTIGRSINRLTQMQTAEQNWVQFTWELERVNKELEVFLALTDDQKFTSAREVVSRLRVASARLNLFAATLDKVK